MAALVAALMPPAALAGGIKAAHNASSGIVAALVAALMPPAALRRHGSIKNRQLALWDAPSCGGSHSVQSVQSVQLFCQSVAGSHRVTFSQSVSFSASPWPAHILLTSSQIRGRLTPGQLPLFIHRNAVWRHWWRHYGGISGGMAAWLAAHNASSGIVAALVAALAPPAALAAAWRHGGISGGIMAAWRH